MKSFWKTCGYFLTGLLLLAACAQIKQNSDLIPPEPDSGNFSLTGQVEFLNQVIQRDDKNPEYYYQRARLHYESARINAARRDIDNALRLNNTPQKYYLLKAKVQTADKNYDEALQAALIAENSGLKQPDLYMLIGELYYYKKNWNESLKYFQRSMAFLPDLANISFFIGSIYAAQNDTTNAVRYLKDTIVKDPDNQPAHFALMNLYVLYDNYTVAKAYADQGAALFTPDAAYSFAYGEILEQTGQPDSAVYWFEQTLALDPNQWNAHLKIASHLMKKRDFPQAEKSLRQALALKPDIGQAYIDLGYIYEYHLNDYYKALNTYQTLAEVDSANLQVPWLIKRVERKISFKQFFDNF
jgi:tetratricopeptide (TPR) repeat protein